MSIRAKLFSLTMIITTSLLAAVFFLEIDYISKILKNDYKRKLFNSSRYMTSGIDQKIDLALSEHAGIFTTVLNTSPRSRSRTIKRILDNSSKFKAISVVKRSWKNNKPKTTLVSEFAGTYKSLGTSKNVDKFSSPTVKMIKYGKTSQILLTSNSKLSKNEELVFYSVVSKDAIIDTPIWSKNEKSFVLDYTGKILTNNSKQVSSLLKKLSKKTVNNLLDQKSAIGIYEKPDRYLISYSGSSKYPIMTFNWHSLSEVKAIVKKEGLRQLSLVSVILMITLFIVYNFAGRFTKNIRLIAHRMSLAAKGDLDSKIDLNSKDELGILAQTLNWMLDSLKTFTEKEIQYARVQSELDTANLIQSRLLPGTTLESKYSKITSHYEAMSKCGGDWWSHFIIDDRHEYYCIADATGHGPSAAIVTALAYSVFENAKEEIEEFDSLLTPLEIIKRMNDLMAKKNLDGITMTASIIMIDHHKKTLSYCNGGHVPILLLQNGKVKNLIAPGSIVGLTPDGNFSTLELQSDEIDRIVMLSDGIIEAKNPAYKLFGHKRVRNVVKNNAKSEGQVLIDALITECNTYRQGVEIEDDYTLVVVDLVNQKSTSTANKKPEAKETEAKETESKETEAKETEAKETEAKETEAKETEAKEPEAKETEAKSND